MEARLGRAVRGTATAEVLGLIGVAERLCCRYHANTGTHFNRVSLARSVHVGFRGLLLWPNLEGSEDAPATANRGDEKKVFTAVSISR